MTQSHAILFAALSVTPLFGGCADEKLSPVTQPSATTTVPGTGGGGPGTGGGETGTKVRDVLSRNTVGLPVDNLFADGDFELSIVPSAGGQYGWLLFDEDSNPAVLTGETGGLCKSGVRCGRVPPRSILFGRATSAPDEAPMRGSIWMKPVGGESPDPANPCALANVRTITCDGFSFRDKLEPALTPTEDGWCEISGPVEPSRRALCFYITLYEAEVVVDAATLLPAPEPMAKKIAAPPLSPAEQTRAAVIRETIRSRMPMGEGTTPVDPYAKMRDARGD